MGFRITYFKRVLMAVLFVFSTNTANANQKILVWGDSLSAAYGIPVEKGWVNLMRKKLGDNVEITNGSISGETTQGGLTRFAKALKKATPDFVILELGANDGLRGLPPSVIKQNLTKIIEQAKKANAEVLLLGMRIPPNYGVAYSQKFEKVFSDLAKQYQLPFIPFFLDNIVTDFNLLQEDELHPAVEAQPLILANILPLVNAQLKKQASLKIIN
ncbi:MAG TPA: arylesterase [Leucothrix sp.]|nr:arylesterase [Leucothrix sp.]